jgi:hypothetical protein
MSWMGKEHRGRKERELKLVSTGHREQRKDREGLTFDIINLVLHYTHGGRVTPDPAVHTELT